MGHTRGTWGIETVRGRRTATIPGRFIIETSFGEEFARWLVRSFRGPVAVSLVKRIASRSIACWVVDAVGTCPGEVVVRKRLFTGWHLPPSAT